MAINAYTGLMGSGKSFEVVSSVIVPAVLAGRRVVTNIDGINPNAIYEYCTHQKRADLATLGKVIQVSNADVMKPGFFPTEESAPDASVVQAGDMVAIDEAWEFWSNSNRISVEHQRFFRMHRHYVHPDTGTACDVVLMIQSIMDLHRQLRAVVEITFRTKKLKELGASRYYRVEMYETAKVTKAMLLDTFNKSYDQAIFPLYKSYASGKGHEKAIDRRQNLLANKRLWVICVAMIVLWGVSVRLAWRFFSPDDAPASTKTTASGDVAQLSGAPAQRGKADTDFSTDWRLVGRFSVDEARWIVVANARGLLRLESPSQFSGAGLTTIGTIDGQRVSTWSGETTHTSGKQARGVE